MEPHPPGPICGPCAPLCLPSVLFVPQESCCASLACLSILHCKLFNSDYVVITKKIKSIHPKNYVNLSRIGHVAGPERALDEFKRHAMEVQQSSHPPCMSHVSPCVFTAAKCPAQVAPSAPLKWPREEPPRRSAPPPQGQSTTSRGGPIYPEAGPSTRPGPEAGPSTPGAPSTSPPETLSRIQPLCLRGPL